MSDANREMANSLLDSIDAQFVAGIAEGRRLPPEAVRRAIDEAPVSPEQLQKAGLIDGIQFWDELDRRARRQGQDRRGGGLRPRGSPSGRASRPTARFALIYGSGNVVVGRGHRRRARARRSSPRTPSAEALADAAEDADIQAIILRIDSPGGSPLASDQIWRAARQARAQGQARDRLVLGPARPRPPTTSPPAPTRSSRSPASLTGSIGVFVVRPVLRELLGQARHRRRVAHARRLRLAAARLAAALARARAPGCTPRWSRSTTSSSRASPRDATSRVEQVDRWRAVASGPASRRRASGLVDEIGGLRVAVRRALQQLEARSRRRTWRWCPTRRRVSLAEQLDETLRSLTRAAPTRSTSVAAPRRALARGDAGGRAGPAAALHSRSIR